MANREENLKKINNDLELMSDEELGKVAGGGRVQTSWDSHFLHYDVLIAYWSSGSTAIKVAWDKAGITAKTYFTDYNDFDKNTGKPLSLKEAYTLALKNRGFNDIAVHDFNFDKYGNLGGYGA